jgi:hypothetical protein
MIADLEFIMTKTLNLLSLSTLALVGAIFALPAISSDANASATSQLMRCQFNTKQKVVDCCQRVLRDERKPQWMKEASGNCSSAAVCVPGKKQGRSPISFVAAKQKPKCFIKIRNYDEPIKGGESPDTPREQRGTQNSKD